MGRRIDEEPTHAGVWLNALLDQFPQHKKGDLYVGRFSEACEALKKLGVIEGYRSTTKNSKEDRSGVDVLVLRDSVEFPFQITSTLDYGHEHIQMQNAHPERPSVRVVYVREGNKPLMKSVENLQKEIILKLEKGPLFPKKK